MIEASSRGADLPTKVRSLDVDADGQTAFDLTWRKPSDPGGHDIEGYLIQWALDDDGEPGDAWEPIAPEDTDDAPLTVVGEDELEYNWEPESPNALTPVRCAGSA